MYQSSIVRLYWYKTVEKFFSDLNIYVEIFNKNINESDCVIPILESYGANVWDNKIDS